VVEVQVQLQGVIRLFVEEGYSLVFEDLSFYVYENKTKQKLLVHIPMVKNKIFPLNLVGEKQVLKVGGLPQFNKVMKECICLKWSMEVILLKGMRCMIAT
jgi:hypothetical protein